MKRFFFHFACLSVLLVLSSCASAPDPIPPEVEGTPLRNRYYSEWGGSEYRFLDGTKVSRSQLENILLEVPGNDKVLRNSKIAWGTGWAWLGVWCAAVIAGGIYEDSWPGAEAMGIAMPIVETMATVGMIGGFCWGIWEENRAVGNYNLYIQGIPVR